MTEPQPVGGHSEVEAVLSSTTTWWLPLLLDVLRTVALIVIAIALVVIA